MQAKAHSISAVCLLTMAKAALRANEEHAQVVTRYARA
jgi:hypothetical protein